ncbi:Ycf48-like protein [bacterium HR33]|nr:Ycf48-like protein [bacterium HR33]
MLPLLRFLALVLVVPLALLAGSATAQIDPARLAGLKARSIGPSGMSGRISAIDAVERDPNIIYVGSATGGLWKSTSGGVTWEPLTDSLPAYSIGAVAIFQAAPDIVWIGTGERNRRNTAGVGTGVYKSMDGGKTWRHLGLDSTGAIDAIILHPTDPDIAYVGALGNTWTESPHRGVYRTTDGGKTWQKILYVNETTGAGDLVMDPSNPNHLLAATWDHRRWPWFFRSGGPGSGLYVTYDGGDTWKKLGPEDGLPEGELGRIGLDFARSNPKVVYAIVEATRSVLLRSEDGGNTWKVVNRERGIAERPFYYAQVRVDPTNENRVYNVHGTIDLSEDGGKTFRVLLPFERVHVDHHALWISPDGKILYDGNDGGVYISRDRGASWRFVENLPLAQFYHIAVDWETPYNVMGGLQDNGSWRGPSQVWHNGGIRFYDWKEVGFGDGFATLPDPRNRRYLYTTSQGGNIIRSDLLTGERKAIRPAHPEGIELRFNWNPAMAIDPHDGALYFGSQFVHRSTDLGNTWTIISPDLTTNDPEKQKQLESGGLTRDVTSAENYTTILVIAPSPVERGVIWVGTDDGNVQLTRDGGATWTNLASRIRGVPPNTWIPHIEASPHDAATAFVVFDDHRRGNNRPYVFKTTDYGRTWTSLVTDEIEPFNFVHVIEQDPIEPNLLFLGTEHGMYVSFNGGRNWQLWRHGLPRVPVLALVVHPREHDLVIGTHGRAAYILDDIRPLRALARDPTIAQKPLHLFEIPEAIKYEVAQVDGMRFTADAMFKGENRPYGALITYSVGGTGLPDSAVTVEVLDAGGEVIRRFPGPAKPGVNRIAWDLRRDGFRRPRGERQEEPEAFRPAGPPVLPGTYTARVKLKDHEASATVVVRDDPRFDVPLAAQREKFDVIMRVGQRQEVAAEAVDRLREAKRSVDRVLDQLNGNSDTSGDLRQRVRAAADSLKKRLAEVEELFTGPQDVQGIVRAPDAVLPQLDQVYGALTSSRDAPTEAQMLYLREAEADLSRALERVNALFSGPVAEFRRLVQEANLEWFPAREPLSLDWRPNRQR